MGLFDGVGGFLNDVNGAFSSVSEATTKALETVNSVSGIVGSFSSGQAGGIAAVPGQQIFPAGSANGFFPNTTFLPPIFGSTESVERVKSENQQIAQRETLLIAAVVVGAALWFLR